MPKLPGRVSPLLLFLIVGEVHCDCEVWCDCAKCAKIAGKSLADCTCVDQRNAVKNNTSTKTGTYVGDTKVSTSSKGIQVEADTCLLITTTGDSYGESGFGRDYNQYAKVAEKSGADRACAGQGDTIEIGQDVGSAGSSPPLLECKAESED